MNINQKTRKKISLYEGVLSTVGKVTLGVVAADAYHKGGAYGVGNHKGGEHITDTVINAVKDTITENQIGKYAKIGGAAGMVLGAGIGLDQSNTLNNSLNNIVSNEIKIAHQNAPHGGSSLIPKDPAEQRAYASRQIGINPSPNNQHMSKLLQLNPNTIRTTATASGAAGYGISGGILGAASALIKNRKNR